MNYTLDTDAIRKRFAEAIVINWCDNRIDILIPCERRYINLSTGGSWDNDMLHSVSVNWIIRPGDRVECKHREDDDTEWQPRTYWGYSGDNWYPFRVKGEL